MKRNGREEIPKGSCYTVLMPLYLKAAVYLHSPNQVASAHVRAKFPPRFATKER